jgi:hypothetical protein
MEARFVQFCVLNVTPPIMIANVPAEVCLRCGGEVFADSTVEVLERIRDGLIQPNGMALARYFDFARIQRVPVATRQENGGIGTQSTLVPVAETHLVYA